MAITNDVPRRIKRILHERGWNLARLAGELRVDQGTVKRWLTGKFRPRLGSYVQIMTLDLPEPKKAKAP